MITYFITQDKAAAEERLVRHDGAYAVAAENTLLPWAKTAAIKLAKVLDDTAVREFEFALDEEKAASITDPFGKPLGEWQKFEFVTDIGGLILRSDEEVKEYERLKAYIRQQIEGEKLPVPEQ